ncbi:hypothetical protein [Lactobacillus amylolyticus]|uniref:hypothetical protein n=1 Tax=Lactobacillus amylolyticus TaxID=83683 RepID=UPI000FCA1C72|nr:hypothetical protein [Lactobacillus amylolyticus]
MNGKIHKYRDLSVENIKKMYKNDAGFRRLFAVKNEYIVRIRSTITIFDFSAEPIASKYQTVILDNVTLLFDEAIITSLLALAPLIITSLFAPFKLAV